jgi:hypothetical protein
VVREAAGRMADAFDAQIDAFGDKLLEFVARASEEMSQSMADVVRAARDAQREGEHACVAMESTGGSVLARLGALEQRMKAMRGGLWGNGQNRAPDA